MHEKTYLESLKYKDLLALAKTLHLTKTRLKRDLLISMIFEADPENTITSSQEVIDRRATFDVPPAVVLENVLEETPANDRRGTFVVEGTGSPDTNVSVSLAPINEELVAPKHRVLDLSQCDSPSSDKPRRSRRKWSKPVVIFNRRETFDVNDEGDKENATEVVPCTSRRETFDVQENPQMTEDEPVTSPGEFKTSPKSLMNTSSTNDVVSMKNAIDMLPNLNVNDSPANRSTLRNKRPSVFERLTTPMSLNERRSISSVPAKNPRRSSISSDKAHRITLLSAIRSTRASNAAAASAKKTTRMSKGTPRKIPNFAKIHEKQFEKMTSLVDFKKRQLERAQHLLSPVRLVQTVAKAEKIAASAKKSLLPVAKKRVLASAAPTQNPAVTSSSTTQLVASRSVTRRNQQKEAIKNKAPVTKSLTKEKTMAAIKEVRTNRRFQLLYESSRLKRVI